MPLYGYVCKACHSEFETLVFSSDIPSCPSCESTDLTRQLSLIAPPAKSGAEGPMAGVAPMCDGHGSCGMCSSAAVQESTASERMDKLGHGRHELMWMRPQARSS